MSMITAIFIILVIMAHNQEKAEQRRIDRDYEIDHPDYPEYKEPKY